MLTPEYGIFVTIEANEFMVELEAGKKFIKLIPLFPILFKLFEILRSLYFSIKGHES